MATPNESGLAVRHVVRWYFDEVYARREGPGTLPFYCDPDRVGAFAIAPHDVAAGGDAAVFRLLITLSMYQALRDVVIMRQQRSLPRAAVRVVADAAFVERSLAKHSCPVLLSANAFEKGCDVSKRGNVVDCGTSPGTRCHVKDATAAFNRMGDMGKLPTSAWLRLWKDGGVREVLADVCRAETAPTKRAALLVERFAKVHRVGRKLATMVVSALSMPALAPGLTPWFPDIDGNELVVVDTNLARAVDTLRLRGAEKELRGARALGARAGGTDRPPAVPSRGAAVLGPARAAGALRLLLEVQPGRAGRRVRQRRDPVPELRSCAVPVRGGHLLTGASRRGATLLTALCRSRPTEPIREHNRAPESPSSRAPAFSGSPSAIAPASSSARRTPRTLALSRRSPASRLAGLLFTAPPPHVGGGGRMARKLSALWRALKVRKPLNLR